MVCNKFNTLELQALLIQGAQPFFNTCATITIITMFMMPFQDAFIGLIKLALSRVNLYPFLHKMSGFWLCFPISTLAECNDSKIV